MKPTLEIDLRDAETLRRTAVEHLPVGGLLIETRSPPALFQPLDIALRLSDGEFRFLKGQAVNHAPKGVFVVLEDAGTLAALKADVDALFAALPEPKSEEEEDLEASSEDAQVRGDQEVNTDPDEDKEPRGPLAGGTTRPAWELLDNASDVPLHKQVAQLTVNDKLRLARQANRPVRRILIRDMEKRVHLEVIKNPQVKDDEAIEYAGTSGVSPAALEWLSGQSRYAKNKKMVMTLITNPMTPPRVARKLLDKLNHRELLKVMRSPRSREAIVRECKKRLMKAGIL